MTKKIVFSALMAALVCLATFLVKIPLPANGYVHLGDCFVLLSGWLLGPFYGAAAAGIGSMLADVFAGYPIYVPATLIIKAVSALIAAFALKALDKTKLNTALKCAAAGICGGVLVPAGYFIFEYFVFSPETAIIDVWGVSLKEIVGIFLASMVYTALSKSGAVKKLF